MSDLKSFLEIALSFEKSGQEFYRNNMQKVNQSVAKKTFGYLMDMEASHVKFIEGMIEALEDNKKVDSALQEEAEEIFLERLKSQALSNNSYSSDLADLSILRMAYLIERDFVDYYENASKKVEDVSAKKLMVRLMNWEKGHVSLVRTLMERIYEKNAIDLGFYPF
ncbi:MAG: ferritin family protein [Mesotoga sp.]|nr:ferritin family protein [Mesotoga sp.]